MHLGLPGYNRSVRPRKAGEAMLKDYPIVVHVVVRWGDMDSLGHVNNTLYLQYFETARIEYLVALGMDPPGPTWQEYGLILASVDCRFKVPVTYPDTLSVATRVSALGDDRVLMEHAAFSHKLDRVAAEGDAVVVSYDYVAGRRTSLLPEIRDAILALEKRDIPVMAPPGQDATTAK
jgi:acyl-CoA thioester hydrolase